MRTVVQKIGRLVLRMFCRALAGGFRAHAFLKWTSTNSLSAEMQKTLLQRSNSPATLLSAEMQKQGAEGAFGQTRAQVR